MCPQCQHIDTCSNRYSCICRSCWELSKYYWVG